MTQLETKRCAVCGGELYFEYTQPPRLFKIENGVLVEEEENVFIDSEFNAYCENDREHDIETAAEVQNLDINFNEWVTYIFQCVLEKFFIGRI